VTSDPRVFLIVPDAALRDQVRQLADAREGTGPAVVVSVVEGTLAESIARVSAISRAPVGVIVRTSEAIVAAIDGGTDDACTAAGMDLAAFVAFIDRVLVRARRRRDVENSRAAALHGEKLTALGTLVAGVAHEINNPLSVVILVSQLMRSMVEPLLKGQEEVYRLAARRGPASEEELRRLAALIETRASASEVRGTLDDVDAALDTIREVVRGLRVYARTEDGEKEEPVSLPELVDQVVRVVGKGLVIDATLERDYGANLPTLLLPRGRMVQVLTNLLINAVQAIAQVERPVHRIRIAVRYDEEMLALSVSDSGPGISSGDLERIFDPFFTTKRLDTAGTGGGSGLGLSISRSIMQAVGGDLVAESVHGQGATFVMIIPTAGRKSDPAPPSVRTPVLPGEHPVRPSVLVVEDDERILRNIALSLRGRYDVMLAVDGQEAIDLLSSGSVPDAVLSDVTMPVVGGAELHQWLVDNRPALANRTVFMTASSDSADALRAGHSGRPVLEKPLTRERLLSALGDVLGGVRGAS
jgi:signal transduction histidine kinase